jgi:L-asparaginase/Glu-tRNA(Gln) amidotransferase subunit D
MLRRFNSTTGDARIVIITTGGTIVQKFDTETGQYKLKEDSCPNYRSV